MRKVPELRFDGFDGEWEEKTFNDLAEYKKGPFGSSLKKEIFVQKSNSTVKVYEQKNAIEKDWKLERYFITFEYYQKMKSFSVGPGDIIVSCAGTIGEMYELPKDSESGIINQALMKISINTNIDKTYFMLIFDKMITKFSVTKSNGSAIKNIPPFRDLKPARALIPTVNEQEKIGNLFRKIDDLIEIQEDKVSKIRDFKKSMLQKMFPKKDELVPEFRFGGFDGEWEIKKIKEIASVKTGKSDTKDADDNGTYPFYIRSDEPVKSSKYLYDEEAVLTIGDGQIGKVFFYVNGKYDLHQRVYRIFDFTDDIDAKYFYHYFSRFFLRRAMRLSAKGTVDSVRMEMITEMEIKIPQSKEEQIKIRSFLDNLDIQIENEEKLLDSYKMMKKSLLQKMFV